MAIRASRRAGAWVLAASALLVGVGCGGAGGAARSSTPSTQSPTTRPAGTAVTQVLTFQAFDDRGLLPNLVRAVSEAGACTGGSVVVPGRADAWRCTAGGAVLDPCFSAEGSSELACVPDPFTSAVTIVAVTGPLPRGNRNDPAHPPWFLELVDGSRCGPLSPEQGDRPAVAGLRPTYACGGTTVFGDPDASGPVWHVQVGPDGGAASLVLVDVKVAWY